MTRSILGVIAGLVAMVCTVGALQWLSQQFWPPPPGIDFHDPAQVRALIATLPWGALAMVVLSWTLGSLLGGFVAAKLARSHRRGAALAIGLVMLALVGLNLWMYPHPAWMIALGLLLPLPAALLGRELAD
jgi:hypothetical protein